MQDFQWYLLMNSRNTIMSSNNTPVLPSCPVTYTDISSRPFV